MLADLRIRFPNLRILSAKPDVTDAFRNVRVASDQAHFFCYMVDGVLVADFRLTFGWASSSRHWGIVSEAAAYSHQNTVEAAEILPEAKAMMSHVTIAEPWKIGRPTQAPYCVRIKMNDVPRGGPHEPFFATVYVDAFIMARVQADPTDHPALVVSVSLASDHIRLFGPGEADATGPKKEQGFGHHRRLARFYGQNSHSTYSGSGREDCRHQTYARAGVATYSKVG